MYYNSCINKVNAILIFDKQRLKYSYVYICNLLKSSIERYFAYHKELSRHSKQHGYRATMYIILYMLLSKHIKYKNGRTDVIRRMDSWNYLTFSGFIIPFRRTNGRNLIIL